MSSKSILACLSLTVCLAAAPTPASAGPCASAEDEMTLNARVLQTELMVAALRCNQQQRYNAFVRTFRRDIATQGALLRALFGRAYGRAGKREMNAYVTKLANDASNRSLGAKSYCASAQALWAEVQATPANGFARLTRSARVRGRHGFARCR